MIEIKRKELCTGCYACYSICPKNCITFESDDEGFFYPVVDKRICINCGLCEKVCPTLQDKKFINVPNAYAAYNNNENIRLQSSSGGVFTLIAEYVINNNGVVFGAIFDNEFNVIHGVVEDKDQLDNIRGSKYVQSKIGDSYRQVKYYLQNGKQVYFTGTPCQIAGLKRYLGKDYDNLLCQDIICQGVPSPLVWRSYLACRIKKQGKGNQVKKVSFRSKDNSWKQYKIKIDFDSGYVYQKNKAEDNYLKVFMKFMSLRPSCFECKFKGQHRESDISLADFWGIQNIEPSMDDNKGTSLILINTSKGQEIFNQLKNRMTYMEVKFLDSIRSNPMYNKSISYNDMRNDFFKELYSKDFDTVTKIYLKDSIVTNLLKKMKMIYKIFKIRFK